MNQLLPLFIVLPFIAFILLQKLAQAYTFCLLLALQLCGLLMVTHPSIKN